MTLMAKLRPIRLAVTIAVFSFLAGTLFGADQPPTLRLPDTVAPTSYRVELTLDPAKPDFSGSIAIQVNVKQPVDTIWLNAHNIKAQEATFETSGKQMTAKVEINGNNFLGLHFDSQVSAGPGEIKIRYAGQIQQESPSGLFQAEDKGNHYLLTQFENTDARDAFPCFDEPSYKVPWQLTLNIPQQNVAVSNTPPESHETQGDRIIYRFKETKPLPSYLVAFAVGPFEFVPAGTAGRNHVPVRIVVPKDHANEAKYAAEVTATILTRLEDYFGIPYPFEKADQVTIPMAAGFAMENAGMVTYDQRVILADPARDTISRQREYAETAAHELAHQWFGDLVTTAWWNDIWLNEAFATWTEQKIIAEWKPEWHTRIEDVHSKLMAEENDSLVSARMIRQEIKTQDDIANAFDNITYDKGAAVIGMFENWIGAEEFRRGVHTYLEQYAFKTATAPEFLDAISSSSHKNITGPFNTFLNQAGVPLISVKLECNQGAPTFHVDQKRYLPLGSKGSASQVWGVPVCVRYGTGESGESECSLLTQASADWSLKHAKGCPAWVEANGNAVGYYRVNYGHGMLSSLTEGNVEQRLNAPERVDFMGNAASLAKGGILPAADALGLVGTFHDEAEHDVVQNAMDLALGPKDHLVPQNLEPNYHRFLLQNFQARARKLGWVPKPDEDDNARLLRPVLVRQVATYAGDEELANQARELAAKWFQDRDAVDASMVASVLATAAYYGDKALFNRFLAKLKDTQDQQERSRILDAMARFRDPAAIEAGMQGVASGEIPFMEGIRVLFAGQGEESTRKLAFEFMKSHFNELLARRPTTGGMDVGGFFPYVGASFCDQESKQELRSFFEPKLKELTGAPRILDQTLEGIDVCIANKAAQEPSVVAFLKHY